MTSQDEQNYALDSKVKDLQQKVFALKNDPRTLEEKAREEGMARPNELIFMFDKDQTEDGPKADLKR